MNKSLQKHSIKEITKQLSFRMKKNGLETIKVHVTGLAGKLKCDFTGSADQVVTAKQILAAWA
ncbi:MAG: hypothetical protein JWM68_739 [Verrucomicrobiales bacterium]|nr:hypothetical protein [Verrucomicrobiales bacterium]